MLFYISLNIQFDHQNLLKTTEMREKVKENGEKWRARRRMRGLHVMLQFLTDDTKQRDVTKRLGCTDKC